MNSVVLPSLPSLTTLTLKLDRNNYNFWRAQVLSTVRAHGFEDFLHGECSIPSEFLPESSELSDGVRNRNPDYQVWLRRDQFLFSWLLSSISESMLGHVSRCTTSAETWGVLDNLFRSQSRARIMHLRLMLQTLKKGDSTVEEYVLKMRTLADNIQAAGQTLSDDDLILYILGGFGPEYESVVVNLTSRNDTLTLQEVQFALQTHEMRLQQQLTSVLHDNSSPHSAHTAVRKPGVSDFSGTRGGYSGFSGPRGGHFGRGRGRGRFNRGSKPLCQLCGKTNHLASKCFRRFDVSFAGLDSVLQQPSFPQAHYASTPVLPHSASRATSAPHQALYAPSPEMSQNFTAPHNHSSSSYFDPQWYIDSGATNHVTADLSNLSIHSDYKGGDKLAVGQNISPSADERRP